MNPQVLDMHAIHTQDGNEQQPEQAHSYEPEAPPQETHYMHDQFHIHEAEEQAEYYGDYYGDY